MSDHLLPPPYSHERPAPYGPFHRLASPTQTAEDARKQSASQEIWGTIPRLGRWPRVEAYAGALPADAHGIEFYAFDEPDRNGRISLPTWTGVVRPDIQVAGEFAKISCVITRNTQTEDES